jgi:phage-related protein
MMRIYELIRDLGLPAVGKPYIDHVQGKLWELRAQDKDGWGRALYCTVTGRTVVILRCFSKKTNKTPRREINLALDRMREMR